MGENETERERMLHAMYDAWIDLQRDAEHSEDTRYAGVARAILGGQLRAAEYAPFLRAEEWRGLLKEAEPGNSKPWEVRPCLECGRPATAPQDCPADNEGVHVFHVGEEAELVRVVPVSGREPV